MKARFTSLLFSALIAGAPVAISQPLFDVQFDADQADTTPAVSTQPDIDGVLTRPSFIRSTDGYGIVVRHLHETLDEAALLISGKTQVDFVAPTALLQEERDFSLSFDLAYNPGESDRSLYGLKVNFFNADVSHHGYQASVIFVPAGLRVISGKHDQTVPAEWSLGDLLKVKITLYYSTSELEIAINDWQARVPFDPARPGGVRAFQFTGGASNSAFVAGVTNIRGELQ